MMGKIKQLTDYRSPLPELFVDGVKALGFGRGIVRLDLFTLSAEATDAAGNPEPERRLRLLMTPQGFLECMAAMQGLAQQLEKGGVITRKSESEASSPIRTDSIAPLEVTNQGEPVPATHRPISPNFPSRGTH